jgi:hypothetical protein
MFDEVSTASGIRIIKTPSRAPRANAFAERWIDGLRREPLDRILIVNARHLRRVPAAYSSAPWARPPRYEPFPTRPRTISGSSDVTTSVA